MVLRVSSTLAAVSLASAAAALAFWIASFVSSGKGKNLWDGQERGGSTLGSQPGHEEGSREIQPSYPRTNLGPCPACPVQPGAASGAAPSSHGGQPACPLPSAECL